FADMVHHDESGAGGIAQTQQRLAQGGHGAGIVFILIVCGVERVENQDLGVSRPCGGDKVIQTLRGAEQMACGARVHEKMLIGGRSQRTIRMKTIPAPWPPCASRCCVCAMPPAPLSSWCTMSANPSAATRSAAPFAAPAPCM